MNHEDIIRWAQQSGFEEISIGDKSVTWVSPPENLIDFAQLVAAAEREACCAIVYGQCDSDNVAQRTVDAIRARGDS